MDFPPDEPSARLRPEIFDHQLPGNCADWPPANVPVPWGRGDGIIGFASYPLGPQQCGTEEQDTRFVYYLDVPPPPASRPVFVGGSARSPIGASHGALSGWHPVDLLGHVLDDVRQRFIKTTADAPVVDRIVLANATPVGALASPLRSLALAQHWAGALDGIEIGGGRLAGHRALAHGAQLVANGSADIVLVCSVDMASVVPPGAPLLRRDYGKPLTPSTVRELTAAGGHLPDGPFGDTLGFTRDQLDGWVASSCAAARTWPTHLTPTASLIRDPERTTPYQGPDLTSDENLRRNLDDLGGVDPMFDAEGVVTSLSLAQPGDGAVAVLLSSNPGHYELGPTMHHTMQSFEPVEPLVTAALSMPDRDGAIFVASEPTAAHTLALAKGLGIGTLLFEDTGVDGTGVESTGFEGTGFEGTGFEGTGFEGTGFAGTASINPHGGAVARGRLDGGEILQGLHDMMAAEASDFALLSASGDGAGLGSRVQRNVS